MSDFNFEKFREDANTFEAEISASSRKFEKEVFFQINECWLKVHKSHDILMFNGCVLLDVTTDKQGAWSAEYREYSMHTWTQKDVLYFHFEIHPEYPHYAESFWQNPGTEIFGERHRKVAANDFFDIIRQAFDHPVSAFDIDSHKMTIELENTPGPEVVFTEKYGDDEYSIPVKGSLAEFYNVNETLGYEKPYQLLYSNTQAEMRANDAVYREFKKNHKKDWKIFSASFFVNG